MLLTSFSLWWLAIYALRVALWGNPVILYLTNTSPALLAAAEAATDDEDEVTDETAQFMRGFAMRMILGLAMLVLEFALWIRFFWLDILPWLAMALLVRGVAMLAVGSLGTSGLGREGKLFPVLLAFPRWLLQVDRANALITGLGALVFLVFLVLG